MKSVNRLAVRIGLAVVVLACATVAKAQDNLDFTVGGSKWRCQHRCDTMKVAPFLSVEQSGTAVTFTDAKGATVMGTAKTDVHRAVPSKGPSLRCQMNPSYCGKEPPPKTTYYRTIEIPEWNCVVSVQEKDGEPDTPPPFKAKWLRFAKSGCALGTSIWTNLSVREIKAMEKRCRERGQMC